MSVNHNHKHAAIAEYLSLFAMTIITVLAIYNEVISVFYLMYLFWWDELLKTCFDWIKYFSRKKVLNIPAAYLNNIRTRFFFLMIYIVFIIVFFGLMIDWNTSDLLINNFQVFFFRNPLFNLSIITFLAREVYLFVNESQQVVGHHMLSKGILTLHLSLIFGIFLWFLFTSKLDLFEDYINIIAILPFLILKVIFEVREISYNKEKRRVT